MAHRSSSDPSIVELQRALKQELKEAGLSVKVYSKRRARSLRFPDRMFSPCTLTFAHYVPRSRKGRKDSSYFKRWMNELVNGLQSMGLDWDNFGYPEKNWFCDKSSGNVSLALHWDKIHSRGPLFAAKQLEAAFKRIS